MGKLKLKKNVQKYLIILVLLVILSIFGITKGVSIYNEKQYKKTYEYKLTNIGYTKKDANILEKNLSKKDIDELLKKEKDTFIVDLLNEKYYIKKKYNEYIDFHDKNKDYSSRKIVEYVNNMRNHEFYTDITETDISKGELLLTNKYHKLPDGYVPENLVTINTTYSWGELGSQKCQKIVYDAFLKMWEDAKKEGHYLMVNSSYREYEKQNAIFENYKSSRGLEFAENYAAHPGFSEHQTGLSLDIVEKTHTSRDAFTASDAYIWLQNNAYKYGFIQRYKESKEDVTGTKLESWHYRYVGLEVASYLQDNDITFDEYYAYFLDK